MQLDYSLTTSEERIKCVEQLLAETPPENLTKGYLSYMSDYILFVADRNQTKKEKQSEHPIVTKNREVTVNKRQVSYEEIVSNLENGEDGIYALMSNNKNQLLDPKERVTPQDIEEIPGLREQLDLIESFKRQFDKARGPARYHLKRSIIETWQQIYILRASYKAATTGHAHSTGQIKTMAKLDLSENITLNEDRIPTSDGILTLLNASHISYLLCYYSKLKEESWDDLQGDMHFLLMDLEDLVCRTLQEDYPLLYDIVI